MKNFLRKKYLQQRQSLNEIDIIDKSILIHSRIFELKEISETERVGLYIDIQGEVKTANIIRNFWEQDKKIYVPSFKGGRWKFCRYKEGGLLEKGPLGIPQPKEDDFISVSSLEVIFIPGIAFSTKGYRLGYGKGIYDQLLVRSGGLVIGLCFDEFLIEDDFHEIHDYRVDMIISEERVIKIPKRMS